MEIPGITRSEEHSGGDGRGWEPLDRKKGHTGEESPGPARGFHDRVDVTKPDRAALKLLRQRIIHNGLMALDLAHFPSRPQCQILPGPIDAPGWANIILKDINLLFSLARSKHGEETAWETVQAAFKQGAKETLEILTDLGAGKDDSVWLRVVDVTSAMADWLLSLKSPAHEG